jgi:hypothetical protein
MEKNICVAKTAARGKIAALSNENRRLRIELKSADSDLSAHIQSHEALQDELLRVNSVLRSERSAREAEKTHLESVISKL